MPKTRNKHNIYIGSKYSRFSDNRVSSYQLAMGKFGQIKKEERGLRFDHWLNFEVIRTQVKFKRRKLRLWIKHTQAPIGKQEYRSSSRWVLPEQYQTQKPNFKESGSTDSEIR
jgi:hypothetical protein